MISEIIDVTWRTGRDTVGIVLCRNKKGKYKAYIGVGEGWDEQNDAKAIADWGARLSMMEAIAFFPGKAEEIGTNWYSKAQDYTDEQDDDF